MDLSKLKGVASSPLGIAFLGSFLGMFAFTHLAPACRKLRGAFASSSEDTAAAVKAPKEKK